MVSRSRTSPTPLCDPCTSLKTVFKLTIPRKQVSALVGSAPSFCANLYSYLIAQPRYSTPAARQALIRRLREALVKDVCILGVCKPLDAIMEIYKIEREEDKDFSCSRYVVLQILRTT